MVAEILQTHKHKTNTQTQNTKHKNTISMSALIDMEKVSRCQSLSNESPDVESIISSYASFVQCKGTKRTKLFEPDKFTDYSITKRVVSLTGDLFELIFNNPKRRYEVTKNRVCLPIEKSILEPKLTDLKNGIPQLTISNDGTEIFILGAAEIAVYSSNGSFLRIIALGACFDYPNYYNCFDMNNLGQLSILCVYCNDKVNQDCPEVGTLMHIIISTSGDLISKTPQVIGQSTRKYHSFLLFPNSINGHTYVGVPQHNSIYVFDSCSGKCTRKMYGDVIMIKRTKVSYEMGEFDFLDDYEYQNMFTNEGVMIDRNGNVLHEVGPHTFDFKLQPVMSQIGEIFVYKEDKFLIYDAEGTFLRNIPWNSAVVHFMLDCKGCLIVFEIHGNIWRIE